MNSIHKAGELPPDMRLYAIGDIHGCDELLAALLKKIAQKDATETPVRKKLLVFLGDYVDRGDRVKAIIERLMHNLPAGFEGVFLKGNHEALMLDFLNGEYPLDYWLINGGNKTLQAYGVGYEEEDGSERNVDHVKKDFQKQLEGEHLTFFNNLRHSYRCGGYFFAHAGVDPERPLDGQREHDLLWIRHRFLNSDKPLGAIVVHGHTPMEKPQMMGNRIGIDTGAVYGGRLTAVMLEGTRQVPVSVA